MASCSTSANLARRTTAMLWQTRVGLSSGVRLLHTSRARLAEQTVASDADAGPSSSNVPAYPFARRVVTRNEALTGAEARALTLAVAREKRAGTQLEKPTRPYRGIMDAVHAQLKAQYDPDGAKTAMIARRSAHCIPPGSIVAVETWNDMSQTHFSVFAGVCIAIRRRNTSTSLVLRNVVSRTGVEVRFNVYSPLIRSIQMVQPALGTKRGDPLKRARRAKLYFMRHRPDRMPNVTKAIQALRQEKLEADAEAAAQARVVAQAEAAKATQSKPTKISKKAKKQ